MKLPFSALPQTIQRHYRNSHEEVARINVRDTEHGETYSIILKSGRKDIWRFAQHDGRTTRRFGWIID